MQRLLLLIIGLVMVLAGCSSGTNPESQLSISPDFIPNSSLTSEPYPDDKHVTANAPGHVRIQEEFSLNQNISDDGDTPSPTIYDRKVIYTASITIEVSNIESTITSINSITIKHGGFVENLSTHGGTNYPQANMTIRVPQEHYESTITSLKKLGLAVSHNAGIEDVSSQVIDINARLKSLYTQETSLRNLLGDAESISDILSIESELTRIRSEIERFEGQMNFLQGRIDMSSIYISIVTPHDIIPDPPSAFLIMETTKVSKRLTDIKSYAENDHVIIDRVVSSSNNDSESSTISMRVYPQKFAASVEFLENLGKTLSKEVSEEIRRESESTERNQKHNSPITITLTTPEDRSIGVVSIMGIILAAIISGILIWVAFYKTYQAGRNRTDRFIQDQSI